MLDLVGTGRRRDEHHLGHQFHELIEVEGTVIERARQTKAVLDQGQFPRAVPRVLAAHLGHGHVGLVDHHQEVVGEEVQQGEGPLTGRSPVQMRGVVLDARAHAGLFEHLQIVLGPRAKSLGFEQLALALKEGELLLKFFLDRATGPLQRGVTGGVVRGGEQRELVHLAPASPSSPG